MATLNETQTAANDGDLRARFEIAATELSEQLGLSDQAARQLVWDNMAKLVSHRSSLSGSETTVSDVFTYYDAQRQAALKAVPVPAGADPAAVTDGMIRQVAREVFLQANGQ